MQWSWGWIKIQWERSCIGPNSLHTLFEQGLWICRYVYNGEIFPQYSLLDQLWGSWVLSSVILDVMRFYCWANYPKMDSLPKIRLIVSQYWCMPILRETRFLPPFHVKIRWTSILKVLTGLGLSVQSIFFSRFQLKDKLQLQSPSTPSNLRHILKISTISNQCLLLFYRRRSLRLVMTWLTKFRDDWLLLKKQV